MLLGARPITGDPEPTVGLSGLWLQTFGFCWLLVCRGVLLLVLPTTVTVFFAVSVMCSTVSFYLKLIDGKYNMSVL